ncbi:MAG: hypothetical protein IPL39_05080 [Opitutaceae bacterium]|nr:hypothetical protein [Opitutaceae bacterium]
MPLPACTPACLAVRRTLGALLAVCALGIAGPTALARPHLPSTLVLEPLRPASRLYSDPGYLPLVGTVPLRWLRPQPPTPAPTKAPLVLYNPTPASAKSAGASPSQAQTMEAPGTGEPAGLQPKDFLPFFKRDSSAPPAKAGPKEGLLFTPARSALPTSSADYSQQ